MTRADTRHTGAAPAQHGLGRSRNTFWALLLLDVMMGLQVLMELNAGRSAGEVLGALRAPAL